MNSTRNQLRWSLGILSFCLCWFSLSLEAKSPPLVFVKEQEANLYLFPDKSSEILLKLKFGEDVLYDTESLEKPSDLWIPIRTQDNLTGYVPKSYLRLYKNEKGKRFQVLLEEVDFKLKSPRKNTTKMRELTEFLFALTQYPEFTGAQFLHLKAKAGLALSYWTKQIKEQKKNLSSTDLLRELKSIEPFRKLLILTEDGFPDRVDPDYFWNLALQNQSSPYGDYSAFLAIQHMELPECRNNISCKLTNWEKSQLRYLTLFPNGNYSDFYFRQIQSEWKKILSLKNDIPCFPPAKPKEKELYSQHEKIIRGLALRHQKPIYQNFQEFKKYCL